MRPLACLGLAAFLSGVAFSQSTETQPTFEAADVHVTPGASTYGTIRLVGPRRGAVHGTRYEMKKATMVDLISAAYGVDTDKVLGGPSWLEMGRFDIIAKVPAGTTPDAWKAMLQALLADRFKLAVHKDTQSLPAYALKAGRKPAMKQSDGSGDTGCKFTLPGRGGPQTTNGPMMAPPTLTFTCSNITMQAFADGMRGMAMAGQYLDDKPVVDETELKGAWDFTMRYSLPMMRMMGPAAETAPANITLFDAVEKQLGLKLEAVKIAMPVLMVDRVNEKPTDNAPGLAEILKTAPAATEFEVAEVKPSDPEFKGMRFNIQPGGRVTLDGVNLKFLIEQAWDLTDDMLVGAPKWMDEDRFSIIAKAPSVEPGTQVDLDSIWLMVRALLADRFKLTTHREERPIPAYTLLAVKPKLRKADPTSRTRFKEGPASDGKDPRNANPSLARLVTCQNMTMAQFAEQLQNIAGGYIHSPVLDATGLKDSYDFTLSFSPAGMGQFAQLKGVGGGRGGGDAGPTPAGILPEASDPSGAVTLFEAVEKQLGLKLELQKRSASVLVIDHAEQKPTDN